MEQQTFFKKNKVVDRIIWVNKHNNDKGQYMEVYKNMNRVGENIVAPYGEKGKKMARMVESILLLWLELSINHGNTSVIMAIRDSINWVIMDELPPYYYYVID